MIVHIISFSAATTAGSCLPGTTTTDITWRLLQVWKSKFGCKVYAYCQMTNHVHLVIDPGSQVGNLSLLLKRMANLPTRYINTMEKRSGSLGEGRFKSSPIGANEYLLARCRYVELNPVRAEMVEEPWQYPWSSCQEKTGGKELSWLDPDPFYLSIGKAPEEQAKKYQNWLSETIQDGVSGFDTRGNPAGDRADQRKKNRSLPFYPLLKVTTGAAITWGLKSDAFF